MLIGPTLSNLIIILCKITCSLCVFHKSDTDLIKLFAPLSSGFGLQYDFDKVSLQYFNHNLIIMHYCNLIPIAHSFAIDELVES